MLSAQLVRCNPVPLNVTTLRVRGYRNIADVTIELEPDVTVIIGENNSGKTNILDALYASLRINRTIRQGAFELHDYHLADRKSMAGDAGPIELTVTFREQKPGEWDAELLGAFSDVLASDPVTGTNAVVLRVTGTAPGSGKEEAYEWAFLDAASNPQSRKNITALNRLQTLRPFFTLGALRDATREFSRRSTFFAPFISDPTFDEALRDELADSLGEINDKVMEAHSAFRVLETNLADGNALVGGGGGSVTIEAVPSRLSELLANTQISLSNREGATLPLDRHGSGSQSLAVLSLFKAYVNAKLTSRLDKLSRAILTVEEPEGHLHPSAVRSLWSLLSTMESQVVITSHSGELMGEVPLRCVRRVKHKAASARVYRPNTANFDESELRQINYAIRATRGELLFANVWLLVEGRTESMSLPELARSTGTDLMTDGIRVVEYQQAGGPGPFIKFADELGIAWHCLCDGDQQGQVHVNTVRHHLNGRLEAEHVTILDKNLEVFLCKSGFDAIYASHVPSQSRGAITAAAGTEQYSIQVAEALPKRGKKEQVALEVCSAIAIDPKLAPVRIRELFDRCRALGKS
jgi:putative ATP-dependent endonuclease of OLD family